MTRTFTTITDLAAHLSDQLDLDRDAVTEAIRDHGHLFGNYGRIPASEIATLSAAVWTQITGTEYPEEWARQDAEMAREEQDAEVSQ